MSRSILFQALTAYAEDAVWHLTGFAQTVLDGITVVALAALVVATGLHHPAPVAAVSAPVERQLATNCAMVILTDSCITEQVLQPQDS